MKRSRGGTRLRFLGGLSVAIASLAFARACARRRLPGQLDGRHADGRAGVRSARRSGRHVHAARRTHASGRRTRPEHDRLQDRRRRPRHDRAHLGASHRSGKHDDRRHHPDRLGRAAADHARGQRRGRGRRARPRRPSAVGPARLAPGREQHHPRPRDRRVLESRPGRDPRLLDGGQDRRQLHRRRRLRKRPGRQRDRDRDRCCVHDGRRAGGSRPERDLRKRRRGHLRRERQPRASIPTWVAKRSRAT